MSECGIVGLFFGCKSPAAVIACNCSNGTKESNTIKISGVSLEHAMEKSGVDICETDSDTYLSEVGKARAGADSLWVNLAKIVFGIPDLKAKFEALNDGQKRFAVEKLGETLTGRLQNDKASDFKAWGPWHYFGCKTPVYGYKTPSQIDLKITTDDVINILSSKELLAIKGAGTSDKPSILKSYLALYNPVELTARVKAKVKIAPIGIFYAAKEADSATLPSNCKITVGSDEETELFDLNKVAPAKSVKVEVPAEEGAEVKETVISPILLQTPEAGPFTFSSKGTYDIKLTCEKPSKFELKLGELEVTKKVWRKKKKKKVDKGVSGRDIF